MRFLILGSEGNQYYVTEKQLTMNNAKNILGMVQNDGVSVVNTVVEISTSKPARAPKNDACIFALAIAAVHGNDDTKNAAFAALPQVCRIPTHLFQFVEAYKGLGGGWGRRAKRAFGDWYLTKNPNELVRDITKYQSRAGWSNGDILRLAHPTPQTAEQVEAFKWAVGKRSADVERSSIAGYLDAVQQTLSGKLSVKEAVELITQWNLPREVLSTELLTSTEVWEALYQKMPITALIRNLPTMTRVGLIVNGSNAWRQLPIKLSKEALVNGRVHPIQLLVARLTYASGRSMRGSSAWEPVPRVTELLERGFYDSFGSVAPHGKRTLIGLDISGSMHGGIVNGVPGLTPAMASAAMAMLAVRTEDNVEVMGFGGAGNWSGGAAAMKALPFFNRTESLESIVSKTRVMNFGTTDCALPMIYAEKSSKEFDLFQIWTDNETWAGGGHPFQALKNYRQKTGINAKLVVCATLATPFTIADPSDPGMLDCVGFDTATPNIISEFVRW